MLRIGICDDEGSARDSLRFQLERYLYEKSEEIVYEFTKGEVAVNWILLHPGEIDLLFLDVEMQGLSGMDAASKIREYDTNIMIVFVTGYPDFVFDGYKVGAFDYIVKPLQEQRIAEVLKRVRFKISSEEPEMLTIQNTEGIYRIRKRDILYCYSDKRQVRVVTADKEIPFYAKLDGIQEKLKDGFVRIHQRFLVRADAVDRIDTSYVIIGNKEIPISRSLKQSATMELTRILLRRNDL